MKKRKEIINHKISICTVCMNRLHHLKITLPQNIEDNKAYQNIEFVLLNYNSEDGMDEWVKNELGAYIKSGLLVYVKTDEPRFFHRSHSRNVAFQVASGDIVCNIDADNFMGKGFAEYINRHFNRHDRAYLVASPNAHSRDVVGRVCLMKEHFSQIRGYDENMSDYGHEDNDLYNRLKLSGLKEVFITNLKFLKSISHGSADRIKNEKMYKTLKYIFLHFISEEQTEIIVFNNDDSYIRGTLITNDEQEGAYCTPGIKEKKWQRGSWKELDYSIALISNEGEKDIFTIQGNNLQESENILSPENQQFYKIVDPNFINWLIFRLPLITNHQTLKNNLIEKKIIVNDSLYGKATLMKNFKAQLLIP